MKIRFWGVRAQTPTPGKEYIKFGGNTPCIEIRNNKEELIILEAGTGIRLLGQYIMSHDFSKGSLHLTILSSDVKWDHTQGFPFFIPCYLPFTVIDWFGPGEAKGELEMYIAGSMTYSYFPIRLNELKSKRNFFDMNNEDVKEINGMLVKTLDMENAHFSLGYSFLEENKKLVYLPGYEQSDIKENKALYSKFVDFADRADVLIHGSYFVDGKDYQQGWGRCSFQHALEFANEVQAKQLIFFGYNPILDDKRLETIVRSIKELAGKINPNLEVIAAFENYQVII